MEPVKVGEVYSMRKAEVLARVVLIWVVAAFVRDRSSIF